MTYQQEVWLREVRTLEAMLLAEYTRRKDEAVEDFITRRRAAEDDALKRLRVARDELHKVTRVVRVRDDVPVLPLDTVVTHLDGAPL